MKKYKYGCDAGSLLVGNNDFQIRIPNHYGDGSHSVFILNRGEHVSNIELQSTDFITTINGKFNLYDYDCLNENELDKHILTTINGYYGIYAQDGTVVFEDWNRYK